MARHDTHSAIQHLEISGPNASMEIEVAITFTYHPALAATGPTYACGGTPPEPAFVEDIAFDAFEVVKNDAGKWVRGPKLEMSPWLEAFITRAIDEDELLAEVSEYEGAF